jgi:predicted RNase H-like HicB family nuclease
MDPCTGQGLTSYFSQSENRYDTYASASEKGFAERDGPQNLPECELAKRLNAPMTHYVGIVEEEEGRAIGVWFPDLPGCVSAGDTLDEAMLNAAEALELWAEATIENGQKIPAARSLTELKTDTEIAQDLARYMVALIPFPQGLRQQAAE